MPNYQWQHGGLQLPSGHQQREVASQVSLSPVLVLLRLKVTPYLDWRVSWTGKGRSMATTCSGLGWKGQTLAQTGVNTRAVGWK